MLDTLTALSSDIIIDAPADPVWQMIAGRFDRIGDWATAIPILRRRHRRPRRRPRCRPGGCARRDTGNRALPHVTETLIAFDAAARSLTYQATAGMPAFVTVARNTWIVTSLAAGRCQVDLAVEFATRGLLGRIARTIILARVSRDGRHLLDDLMLYVENGTPSRSKQPQQHH